MSDDLTPTEYLVLDVLSARRRLGEAMWSFRRDTLRTLRSLETKGYIGLKESGPAGYPMAWFNDRRPDLIEPWTRHVIEYRPVQPDDDPPIPTRPEPPPIDPPQAGVPRWGLVEGDFAPAPWVKIDPLCGRRVEESEPVLPYSNPALKSPEIRSYEPTPPWDPDRCVGGPRITLRQWWRNRRNR